MNLRGGLKGIGLVALAALSLGCHRPDRSTMSKAPTLGRAAGTFENSSGFGQVRPPEFSNGGDPTGHVTNIRWTDWGEPQAVGEGTGFVPAPDGAVADGTFKPTTVVAFDLGLCDGKLMYRAVEWYYPDLGDKFDPHQYQDICKGDYVG